jgi:hypothetical protein
VVLVLLLCAAAATGCSKRKSLPSSSLAAYLPGYPVVAGDVDVDQVRSSLGLPPTADGTSSNAPSKAPAGAEQRLHAAITLALGLPAYAGVDPAADLGLDLSGVHQVAFAWTLTRTLVVVVRTSQSWSSLASELTKRGFADVAGVMRGTAKVPLAVGHRGDIVSIATDPVDAVGALSTHGHTLSDPISVLAEVSGPVRFARLGNIPVSSPDSDATTTTTTLPTARVCTGAWAMGEDPATRTGEIALLTYALWLPPAQEGPFTFANLTTKDGVASVNYEFVTDDPNVLATVTELDAHPFDPTTFANCNPLP